MVVLSPFTVNSEQDNGYAATNTLAGTRLNTPVSDIGASISIYTKDFMEDLSANSANELLIYSTGMEAAGAGGNFSGAASTTADNEVNGETARTSPISATRTRGLAAPNFSRGFFNTSIPLDSYNTDAVTVNRGPNAILFGVGSPAGVVDTTLIRPNLRKNKTVLQAKIGDNSSYRGSVDHNHVLVPGKLGVRIAGVYDRNEFQQRPAFEEKERLYGALTFEPFRSTSIRMNFETGHTDANRPITVLPFDDSTVWRANGMPSNDWNFYDDPARNPLAASQNSANFRNVLVGSALVFDALTVVYSDPDGQTPSKIFRSSVPSTTGTAANALRVGLVQPQINKDGANDAINFLVTLNLNRLPASYWTGANVPAGQQPGFVPAGIKAQGFTDFSAFDFKNRMLDESSRQGDSFHTFNIALEQRALNDQVGIEVAYDKQRYDRRGKNSFFSSNNANHILVDPNVYLADGTLNPNLGRPFAYYGQSTWSVNMSESETWRATAFARYDFGKAEQGWMRWLGRHTLTGLYEENGTSLINYNYRLATDGPAAVARDANIASFARSPALLVYMGDSLLGGGPLKLSPIGVPSLSAASGFQATYFGRAAGTTDPGSIVTAPFSLVEINNGGSATRELIRSQAAVLQSYWLKDHLVTTLGWRRDEDFFAKRTIVAGSPFFDDPITSPNDPGKVHYGFDDLDFGHRPPPNVEGEVKSYSAVLKWPKKLVPLPDGMELGLLYNKSENFTPAGGRVDPYNVPLASPEGKTDELGLNLSLFHGKLNLRYNHFETSVVGQSASNAAFGQATNNAVSQQIAFWAQEGNNNINNVQVAQLAIERVLSVLPSDYLQLRSYSESGEFPNKSVSFGGLAGATDTLDYTAKGDEFEIVYNPTRNWRILMNAARQETVQSNSFPILQEFLSRMTPIWNSTITDPVSGVTLKITDMARGLYAQGRGPGNIDPNQQTFGQYLEQSVYLPLATALATEGTASAEQREWRANLVTSYTFDSGSVFGEKLKGFSIGGGVRWQDKVGLGYPTTRNPDGTVNIDVENPFYGPAETNVDAFVSYRRRIWNNRVDWKIQLNATNIIARDELVTVTVQYDGAPATVRLAPEQRWFLTNTFTF